MRIVLSISDELEAEEAINAICNIHGYQEIINDIPNTETKQQFAESILKDLINGYVKTDRIRKATEEAVSNVPDQPINIV